MRSTFSGFGTAISGLFAAQRALDVIGHNIANENTPGYTRQRATQVTSNPTKVDNGKWLGTGVTMQHIQQIRDELLDIKYRSEMTKKGYWSEKNISLKQVEDIFGEPNGNGVTKALNDLFKSMDDVIKHSDDPTAKANFIQTALTFTRYVNRAIHSFEQLISDTDEEVNSLVTQINTKTKQIAALNKNILEAESEGGKANDLRDKRNILLDELSEMANVRINKSVFTNKAGQKIEKLQLEMDGTLLVDHDKSVDIKTTSNQHHPLYETSQKNNIPPSEDLKNVKVTKLTWPDHRKLDMNTVGGRLGSLLQQRDSFGDPSMGNTIKGIPYYVRALNEFVKSFAGEANRIHKQGVDSNGDKGLDLFTISGTSDQIDARNITVNPDIVNAINKLAIGAGKSESDTKNFQDLYDIRNGELRLTIKQNVNGKFKTLDLGKGNPEDIIKSMITSVLGVDAKEAKDTYSSQTTLALQADMNRMSVSGVSENEELTNMVKYQHAYNASARMITTIDEMIDVIINRMGRVGL
ncbi:flagellar hook-associated protein FlgK [Peptoanaerobacter stomatis]|uniref:Flagellar hook-associated protein 1 n=1 Tax=Peptoanaerobacter stomatis TaxID=796937 RepID=J5W5V1_9FIRM|nr:flagellar hook-associated protein FlgK [Peptoanaerobacter stomatis]EHL18134.1 flagellar hook-associated protein FlgK [Peptoanaerobacter stomatis]EJU19512.1 flagellar hook-associated protein FlgK [Peptoanaerobacter stomatis]NWO25309.1 flagellar hook-associated protein FlgK [Peptostreptococcaceae bacterium oral taxon 081]